MNHVHGPAMQSCTMGQMACIALTPLLICHNLLLLNTALPVVDNTIWERPTTALALILAASKPSLPGMKVWACVLFCCYARY